MLFCELASESVQSDRIRCAPCVWVEHSNEPKRLYALGVSQKHCDIVFVHRSFGSYIELPFGSDLLAPARIDIPRTFLRCLKFLSMANAIPLHSSPILDVHIVKKVRARLES